MNGTQSNDSELSSVKSPLLRTFEVLGDGWTFLILREAFFGCRRFDEYQKVLAIARARLTERLTHLVNHDVLFKRPYSDRPLRHEYLLSEAGHDLYGMIMMMKAWGERWKPSASQLQLIHTKCGSILETELICAECETLVLLNHVRLSSSPDSNEQPQFKVRRQLNREAFEQDKRNDPVAQTLAVIGDQWTMMVLKEAFNDSTTFENFKQRLGIPRGTLSSRLKHLVREEILTKTLYSEKPPRYAYTLTPSGHDLFNVALMMFHWGESWLFGKRRPSYHMIHQTCANPLIPKVICCHCKDEVHSRDVEVAG